MKILDNFIILDCTIRDGGYYGSDKFLFMTSHHKL
jgi:hypothetical protein